MSRYTSATDADRQAMLEAIGAESIDELFQQIPAEVQLGRDLELPDGLSEPEVFPTNDFDDSSPVFAYGKDGQGLVVWPSSSAIESKLYWHEL